MSRIAILTRPAGRNEALARRLADAGWQPLCLPALAIEPLPANGRPPAPQDYDLAVFVSGNAARLYLAQAADALSPAGWPSACVLAAVGPATAEVLRDVAPLGVDATLLYPCADAPAHDSEALWNILSSRPMPRRALLVSGTKGRDWLAVRLAEAGVAVTRHVVYQRRPAVWSTEARQALRGWAVGQVSATWLLTSGEGVAAVADALRADGLLDWWRRCRFVVTHPRHAEALRRAAGDAAADMVVQISMPADEAIFEAFVAA